MKKFLTVLLLMAAIAGLALASASGEGADSAPPAETEQAEWTVMFYFCGSDLESKYSYASGNLKEIFSVSYPDLLTPMFSTTDNLEPDPDAVASKGNVNILIETGGCSEWHAKELGMDISSSALQRWQYHYYSLYDENHSIKEEMQLVETLPLASMSDPETLTDFIRWSVQKCPAKKYALVLWDHGGGSLTGLFIDELFNNDVLYLYELKQALTDAGVTFETVIIDACMMANLETACALRDHAKWMVASEEVVPGKGTAIREWLQELLFFPECDGEYLGRNVCDMTMTKYANDPSDQSRAVLTWSVIDLSQIEQVLKTADRFFESLGQILVNHPQLTTLYARMILSAEEYGDGQQDMRDMTGILYGDYNASLIDRDLRRDLLDALSRAIAYSVRGSGRNGARGLSFCYPTDCDRSELDIYAQNCPSPHYLAFLDAITDWDAPDSVYETAERLPGIETIPALQLTVQLTRDSAGFPGITIQGGFNNLSNVYYRLYYVDEATSQIACLGRTDCVTSLSSEADIVFYANEPWLWPAIDKIPCHMELLVNQYRSPMEEERLYNIPVQVGTTNYMLRCARIDTYNSEKDTTSHTYEIYGVWNGFNENSTMLNRSVFKLSLLAGQEYRLIWPLNTFSGKDVRYIPAGPSTRLYRGLDVAEAPLPPGTYYLEYEISDMFMRPYVMKQIEMKWDGEHLTFPENLDWSGEIRLVWSGGKGQIIAENAQ